MAQIIDDFYFGFFLNESVYFVVEISEKSRLLPFTKSMGNMVVLNSPRAGSQIYRSFRELEAGIRGLGPGINYLLTETLGE